MDYEDIILPELCWDSVLELFCHLGVGKEYCHVHRCLVNVVKLSMSIIMLHVKDLHYTTTTLSGHFRQKNVIK
jgi:hypothetical protein